MPLILPPRQAGIPNHRWLCSALRLAVLLAEARKKLAGLLEISAVKAGRQTVGWLLNGLDGESAERAVADLAAALEGAS